MGIADAPAGQDDLTDVGFVVTIGVLEEDEVRCLRHDHAAVGEDEAGRNVEFIGEDRELVGLAVAVSVFADLDAVVALLLVFLHAVRVVRGLTDPKAAAGIPGERNRLRDVRLRGEEHQLHIRRDLRALHAAFDRERLLEGQRLGALLIIGHVDILLADFRFTLREELLPGRLTISGERGLELRTESGGSRVRLDDQRRQRQVAGRGLDHEDVIAGERRRVWRGSGRVVEPDSVAAKLGHQRVKRTDGGLLLAAGIQIQDADRAIGRGRGGQDGKADRKKSDEGAHRGIRKDKPSPGTWQYDEDKKCSV